MGLGGLAVLHGLHLASGLLEARRVPHPLDPRPDLLLLLADVLLERPAEFLHRGEPRVARGILASGVRVADISVVELLNAEGLVQAEIEV